MNPAAFIEHGPRILEIEPEDLVIRPYGLDSTVQVWQTDREDTFNHGGPPPPFHFPELGFDQGPDRLHRSVFVRAVSLDLDLRTQAGCQHHDPHDALRVHAPAVAA